MKNFTLSTLLVTAAAVAFPVLALTPDKNHQQRIEQRCAEEPDRCEEMKARFKARFEERQARMQAWCEENPQKCEERKARHAERRAWCEQNPQECDARRAERKRSRESMRAHCESNLEQCRARREACREDPAVCPKRHREPSSN